MSTITRTSLMTQRSVIDDVAELALRDAECAAIYRGMRLQLRLVHQQFRTPDLPALARLLPRLRQVHGVGAAGWQRMHSLLERVVENQLAEPHVCRAVDEALEPVRAQVEQARRGRKLRQRRRTPARPSRPRGPRWPTGAALAEALSQRRIADLPLGRLVHAVSPRKLEAIEKALGPQTLGSFAHVVGQMRTRTLKIRGVGYSSARALHAALLEAAKRGIGHPTTLAELLTEVRRVLETPRYQILRDYNDQGVTLRELGQQRGFNNRSAHVQVTQCRKRLAMRFAKSAEQLMKPVWQQLDDAGGLLHQRALDQLAPGVPLHWWPIPLSLSGAGHAVVVWDEFLIFAWAPYAVIKPPPLRQALRRRSTTELLTVSVARELISQTSGWQLSPEGVRRFVERALGLQWSQDAEVLLPPSRRSVPQQAVEVLRIAGRALSVPEISRALIRGKQLPKRLARDERRIETALRLSPFARLRTIRVGQQTYRHIGRLERNPLDESQPP